ncbi:MAG TPA: DUF72 domain-containing protein [Candidatus Dormibacteraeota bacterium]|nr:DUF72 domain-containing protein [Candidatus Dormibacteraeota bacterium]
MGHRSVRVGTCGWIYRHWRDRFYPPGLSPTRWRDAYIANFPAVEVDYSFYRLPSTAAIEAWRSAAEAAPGFRFALKGSRLITHVRRLADVDKALDTYIARVRPLGRALAFVLWQLPPTLELDLPRLVTFLDRLPADLRHCVEFRHPSWLVPPVLDALHARSVACCWVSSRAMPAEAPDTSSFVALRFHGLGGGFAHDYTDEELAPWVERLRAAAASGREAYAFFNNDGDARAPADARELIGLLGDAAMPWPPEGVGAPVPSPRRSVGPPRGPSTRIDVEAPS